MKTTIGLFDSFSEAESAAGDLISAGFSRDDLSLLASDAAGEWSRYKGQAQQRGVGGRYSAGHPGLCAGRR